MPRRLAHQHIVAGLRDRLRYWLDRKGWNAADLKARLNSRGLEVAHPTVRAWINGEGVIPDAYVLLVVCDVLGIRYRWALTGEGEVQEEHHRTTGKRGDEETAIAQLAALDRVVELINVERARLTGGSRDGAAARTVAAALPGAGGPRRRRPAAGE